MTERADLSARALRFVIVGASSSGLYFLSVWLLLEYTAISMLWSSALSYSALVGLAYLAQRNWTFRSRAPHRQSLTRYLCLQMLCMTLTAIMSQGLVTAFSLGSLIAAITSTIIEPIATS